MQDWKMAGKAHGWKMQDWKMTEKVARVENAGLEFDGKKLQGVENDEHTIEGQYSVLLMPVHMHRAPYTFEFELIQLHVIRHRVPLHVVTNHTKILPQIAMQKTYFVDFGWAEA